MTFPLLFLGCFLSALIASVITYFSLVPGLRGKLSDVELEREIFRGQFLSERADCDEANAEVRALSGKLAGTLKRLEAFEADNLPDRDDLTGKFKKRVKL